MNIAALYHRPESEYAALYTEDRLRLRLQTAKGDVKQVSLIKGDPYTIETEKWYTQKTLMKKGLSTATHDYWELEVDAEYQRLQYAFYVEGSDGDKVFYGDQGARAYRGEVLENANAYFRMPYFQEIDRFKAPQWVKDTVWYQIFPERFANGDQRNDPPGTLPWGSQLPGRDDFFGGDLQGVIDHLDHLTDLGITGIYFCPLFTATSNHKYDTVDYLEIDPSFGDKALFKKLVAEAHKRGMRIMLDAVFNHMGDFSPQWQDVVKHGAASKYQDWFHIHSFPVAYEMTDLVETAVANYDTFAFTPHMPKLNTANPEVQAYLLEIAAYWIKECDIDAWRLDVANEVDHHFWKQFYQTVMALKEDFYILGEIWHSSQKWLQGDEFHAVMNYAFTDNIKGFFIEKNLSAAEMISGLNYQQMLYCDQANEVTFNLLDSHDTARILTLCQGNKLLARAALTFMFLQKGAPCIYYGTEIGLEGDNDPDCRRCMVWGPEQDQEMLNFTKQLIAFRKNYADLLTFGELVWVETAATTRCLIFQKTYNGQRLTAYFNEAKEPLTAAGVKAPVSEAAILSQEIAGLAEDKILIPQHGFLIFVEKL